ncbi:hypothetical protein CRENPOLYSF2_1690012 [Crenothrix polyspora]|jgi:type IV pilus assembly protein PilX|uniref:Tfp pilus assembly protein PilX n=1 Tax=Crenothrix polyspora TaxID=360316 RepID=A0A1R4H2Q4_9GAMM|nr:PilX N-terminal domain-containing pilus assembly protein [Crenothrix polyspora]SJM90511.1 hypothetical protein CRENPOLYSF2_1690012 [Crenothrix polyspora]
MPANPLKYQAGVVLVTSLILLLLVTLIGITSVQMTSLEEKMAGNSKDQNLAFQFAEMALRAGEAHIEAIKTGGAGIRSFCDNTPGLFKSQTITVGGICKTQVPDPNVTSTWTDDSKSVAVQTESGLIAHQPRYFIAYTTFRAAVGSNPPTHGFTITARGSGAQGSTQVILRSYYGGEVKFP